MALLTDDQDIREAYLQTILGGNGDFYISVIEKCGDTVINNCVRISTSGGNAPSEVKIAVANLYRAMEAAGLNEFPKF